jgi:ATP/maltotriose-dependent transcriptional regulator MalT
VSQTGQARGSDAPGHDEAPRAPAPPRVDPRPRLTRRLPGRDRPALTLVSAAAGFGKTTLLTQWFAGDADDERTAWLSLDARDNDPVVFVSYVVAALRRPSRRRSARPP